MNRPLRLVFGAVLALRMSAAGPAPCRVEVRDDASNWPVPLVELRTTHQLRFLTDNAGVIALDAPEVLDRDTWFDVIADGYEVPKDGFGYRGVRLHPTPGGTLEVRVRRTALARCLGRLTGGGLLAESQKLGRDAEFQESGVFGCDSVQTALHRGRRFWLWGDTTIPGYPLGIFSTLGATTPPVPWTSFEPPLRPAFAHYRDAHGKLRGIAPLPGDGPTWLTALVSLPDPAGEPRLGATYLKIRPPLDAYEAGLCLWDERDAVFRPHRVHWTNSPAHPRHPPLPEGHAVPWRDPAGTDWLLFGNPFPTLRCPARLDAWSDPARWEVLTPQPALAAAKDGPTVKPHSGSIAWNDFRHRWVTVFMEAFGQPSAFGELWYAEADAPTGPWGPAVKVLSHANYTFYNPRLHAGFTPAGSPVLLFEGTYTRQFADRPETTPRYEYNQILYRLDLDDPALRPAAGTK